MTSMTIDEARRLGLLPSGDPKPQPAGRNVGASDKSLGMLGMPKGITIAFIVPGEPMGKPRMTRRDKWKQRPCVVRYRQWADLARECAGGLPPAERIASLDWVAVFEPPKSWSAKKRSAAMGEFHRSTPDRDNIDKAILDALFKSDSGIANGFIKKVWGSPSRLEIRIVVG